MQLKKSTGRSRLYLATALTALFCVTGNALAADECSSGHLPNPIDFSSIPPATSVEESQRWLEERKNLVISTFAQLTPLPADCREPVNSFSEGVNPRMDSRSDVVLLTTRAVAKILSQQADPELESILLDPKTVVFSNHGTSTVTGVKVGKTEICKRRVADYDFALIDFLNLYFVAKENDPGYLYFTAEARHAIVDKMLNLRGKITETYTLDCGIGILRLPVEIEETENHILMMAVARYLTNEILYADSGSTDFNNIQNGNKQWMLDHFAKLARDHFYEYNSKPYQRYTVDALNVLFSYAEDTEIRTAAKNLLDLISAWSAVQSNNMRRFVPFRRQPPYRLNADGLSGNSEVDRLAVLVGNYRSLGAPNNVDDQAVDHRAIDVSHKALFTIAGKYRMDPVLLDLAIKENSASHYFVGMHATPEIYAYTHDVLIAAGGRSVPGVTPWFSLKLPRFLESIDEQWVRMIINALIMPRSDGERGWAGPTVVIPSWEASTSWEDMIRFEGHRDRDAATRGANLCVAPGFACGLQLKLGSRLEGLESSCSVPGKIPGMRFYNLNQGGECPQYGIYLAVYEQACDTVACRNRADNYGFIEVATAGDRSFERFVQDAEAANTKTRFASVGVHTWNTQSGAIRFEIAPPARLAPIVDVFGTQYGRDYKHWPRARSQTLQSSTPGLVTIDSIPLRKRLILDMTHPANPQNISVDLPFLTP